VGVRQFTYYGDSVAPPPDPPSVIWGANLIGQWNTEDSIITKDGSGFTSNVEDIGNLGADFIQLTASKQPQFIAGAAPNGKDVLRFDGVSDGMEAGNVFNWNYLHDGTGGMIASVFKVIPADPNDIWMIHDTRGTLGAGNVGASLIFDDRAVSSFDERITYITTNGGAVTAFSMTGNNAFPAQQFHVSLSQYEDALPGSDNETFIDNVLLGTGETLNAPSASNSAGVLSLGARSTGLSFDHANIDWLESIVVNRISTPAELLAFITYVIAKWGI
jgi:hypothetical protein